MGFEKTIYETAIEKGISRRDFLKACTALAATLGLDYSQTSNVVQAMETNKRVPVIWLQLMDCTGCSESFIRSSHPRTENVLLDMISLEYSEVLSAASGYQIEANRERVMEEYKGEYILAVEGNVTDAEFLTVAGHSALETLKETAKHAKAVIAYGSCASWGGIAAAHPNPTNARSVDDVIKGVPVMKVPGCPPIAEVMTGVIAHVITFGRLPELDGKGRPKAFYKLRIHDKCNRRAYFDAGLFVESFDDEGAKIGYCLYKVGCKGPTTYNSCAEMRWNGGVSYPIQSGNPCIGCSEKDFWDEGPFFTRRAKIPGTQTTVNPEKVGLYAAGVTVAGIAAHATATAVKKKQDEKNSTEDI
ncbi:hydrogenase small subunit [Anaerobacillus isosaccharinicus]|uniref:Hydrogenase small subunit n=1 Tax=Anaerobacillus isosaccharinicus TaxID=1532552 RepID=A0A1S2LEB4_9BACI|nr:hydrogenase small subunit [Anaerobacillus isosaccharinicus]MBA5585947.1 hydrogenase small subunit [Anaerobacillus isosaccharinicus]QOY35767.1 hydrogenase small subunit [Anaerobacillus isosaccharinicus]